VFGNLFDSSDKHRPTTREERGPGDYVAEKYNAAWGKTAEFTKDRSLSFFGSGFGKGVLAVALLTLAIGAITVGMAASAGTIPVIGMFGTVTAATTTQGVMMGIGEGLSFLMSGAGLAIMGVGGLLGAAANSVRKPADVTVAEAKALAEHYKESRERSIEPQVQPSVAQDAPAATQSTAKDATAKDDKVVPFKKDDPHTKDAHTNKDSGKESGKDSGKDKTHLAREIQRRNDNAAQQVQVG